MKIIKSFRDDEYLKKCIYPAFLERWQQYFEWGLGDNGKLYYKAKYCGCDYTSHWNCLGTQFSVSDLETMKKLLNEFGNLLVFL